MLKYEFKIALRKLLKNKLYSLVNIVGLALGLSACLTISTIVLNDLSYDKQWKNVNQLYKMVGVKSVNHGTEETPKVFSGLGPAIKRTFPEVKEVCRMEVEDEKIKFDEAKEAVNIHTLLAEGSIWDMLDFTILQGDPKIITQGIDNVVITQQIKDKYYKNDNPVGKTIIEIERGAVTKYLITGVIKNIPDNTHLRAEIIVLRDYLRDEKSVYNKFAGGESPASMPQYLLLSPKTNPAAFEEKLNTWYKKQSAEAFNKNTYYLQPMQDIFLRSKYNDPKGIHGSIDTVYIFSLVAMLILLVACINYVNLSTAKAIERMREAAVSRVVGAEKSNIMSKFLLESLLIFLFAFVIALAAYLIAFRFVEQYLGYPLPITIFNSLKLFCFSILTFLLVCVITGLYPSYMLSKIKPVDALKGIVSKNSGMGFLKKLLIVTQFSIALIVLIASITINLQFRFLKNADPGYAKDNLLRIDFINWGTSGIDFKKELLRIPGVENATRATWYPSYGRGFSGLEMKDPRNQNDQLYISYIDCDLDFAQTLKIHLNSGRLFDPNRPSDAIADSLRYVKVLVSDSYAEIFKDSRLDKPNPDFMHIPIGTIKDFHSENFLEKEKPFIITAYKDLKWAAMLIRVTPGSNARVVNALSGLWKKFYPEKDLTLSWVDDLLAAEYRKENKLSDMFNLFTSLAIFLACLGLFGLVTFTLEKRMKEIGIRKVLGASVGSISVLVSRDFLKLVAIAAIIASPAAWYFLNKWLQNYPYRIEVYWWIFIFAAIAILGITVLTISYKTIKAALSNPVKSLRTE